MIHSSELAKIGLFRDVPQSDLANLVPGVMPMRVLKGQTVIEKGERTSDVFIVLNGRLVGVLISAEGKEVAYAEFRRTAYFGELAALDDGPRSLTVHAAEECLVGKISGPQFLDWLDNYPRIARNLMIDLSYRNRGLNERIFELVVHDVETRVRLLLVRLAMESDQLHDGGHLDPAPTHSDIAAHVGANREAVSRVFARLAKSGVIESGRKKITLLEVETLVEGL
ncbi:MAG: Crp/Fnr family transcriptional regulator [Pseudomonadota bacterium]